MGRGEVGVSGKRTFSSVAGLTVSELTPLTTQVPSSTVGTDECNITLRDLSSSVSHCGAGSEGTGVRIDPGHR